MQNNRFPTILAAKKIIAHASDESEPGEEDDPTTPNVTGRRLLPMTAPKARLSNLEYEKNDTGKTKGTKLKNTDGFLP